MCSEVANSSEMDCILFLTGKHCEDLAELDISNVKITNISLKNLVSRCKSLKVHLDPVVQSIVSLTISLRHKFVKQISAKVTNTLLFFVEKM